jgi:hypothetical protein
VAGWPTAPEPWAADWPSRETPAAVAGSVLSEQVSRLDHLPAAVPVTDLHHLPSSTDSQDRRKSECRPPPSGNSADRSPVVTSTVRAGSTLKYIRKAAQCRSARRRRPVCSVALWFPPGAYLGTRPRRAGAVYGPEVATPIGEGAIRLKSPFARRSIMRPSEEQGNRMHKKSRAHEQAPVSPVSVFAPHGSSGKTGSVRWDIKRRHSPQSHREHREENQEKLFSADSRFSSSVFSVSSVTLWLVLSSRFTSTTTPWRRA